MTWRGEEMLPPPGRPSPNPRLIDRQDRPANADARAYRPSMPALCFASWHVGILMGQTIGVIPARWPFTLAMLVLFLAYAFIKPALAMRYRLRWPIERAE